MYIDKVYVDVDEVLLNSIEAVCQILNKRYNKDLHEKDIMSWNFKEYGEISEHEIEDIFDSKEFFDIVTLNPSGVKMIKELLKRKLPVHLITKGRWQNIELKYDYLRNHGIVDDYNVHYTGIPLNRSKGAFDMANAIFIDDNQDNLYESNAYIKILCENNHGADWNNRWNGLRVDKRNLTIPFKWI
jgi:5'(3')-deoxyribonucleotidase